MPHSRFPALALAVSLLGATLVPAGPAPSAAAAGGGMRLLFADDFGGAKLNTSMWTAMNGAKHHWSRDQVSVHDGYLDLATRYVASARQWQSGSVAAHSGGMLYGQWVLRMRCLPATTKCTVKLWPTSGVGPPEVDLMEMFTSQPERLRNKISVHYGRNHANQKIEAAFYPCTCYAWHTYTVRWTRDELVFYYDTKKVATMSGVAVPHSPLRLGISAAPNVHGTPLPDHDTHFQIDYARWYATAG